ncbi:MAG TPA: SMEK domain-containing protein [Candidatus Paceibacterota bacterium]|nr:SMEK domain-containing protein [Candidatus Paceibacterota bacterium]
MDRQDLINEVTAYLARIKVQTKISNGNGLTDINSHLEDFFCRLLNEILALNLENKNILRMNFPSIDLGDEEKRVSVQVTSENSKTKIDKTIKAFDANGLSSSYDTLKFIIIADKKRKIKSITAPKGIKFDSGDIMDLTDILGLVRAKGSPGEIMRILQIFEEEFSGGSHSKTENKIASEVETIADLVLYISEKKELTNGQYREEPDPQGKIEQRFSSKSEFLKSQLVSLLPIYCAARVEVDRALGLDTAKVEYMRNFLRIRSDDFLTQADGDAEVALVNLTEYFENEISKNSKKKYDYQAIRFYLLDELVKCNVFPNAP